MAIKRYIPNKDTFILSGSTANYGGDEILELNSSSRVLMQFSPELPASASYKATLHLSLADAKYLPSEYTIEAYPISGSWEEGVGKLGDVYTSHEGVTWTSKGSYGNWTTPGGDYVTGSIVSQSFVKDSSKDINLDVTNIVSSSADGMLLKLQNEASSSAYLTYFSEDTHTIYRPYLEIAYVDSVYSSSLKPVDINEAYVHVANLQDVYFVSDKVKFRVGARPLYPERTYRTCSLYKDGNILPVSSSWGIKNEYTDEMVVDFSEYTRISADNSGSYFNIDMSILEPERYYRLLIQTEASGSIHTIDNKSIFKVVRNGRH